MLEQLLNNLFLDLSGPAARIAQLTGVKRCDYSHFQFLGTKFLFFFSKPQVIKFIAVNLSFKVNHFQVCRRQFVLAQHDLPDSSDLNTPCSLDSKSLLVSGYELDRTISRTGSVTSNS